MTSGVDRDADVALALTYLSALGGDDPTAVAALVADDFVNEHAAELGSSSTGRAEYARRLPGFFGAFANRHYSVVETAVGMLREPDPQTRSSTEVVVRYRFGADVDGTRIDIPGVMWISVCDGKIFRRLDCWDSLTYHRQTGTPTDG